MKEKKIALEPRKCEHSVSPLYYKASRYPPICAFCTESLNEKHKKASAILQSFYTSPKANLSQH